MATRAKPTKELKVPTFTAAQKVRGKMAQADYDNIYNQIKSGSYLPDLSLNFPEKWEVVCLEDLERAASRAPEGWQLKRHATLDIATINSRLQRAVKRTRRKK